MSAFISGASIHITSSQIPHLLGLNLALGKNQAFFQIIHVRGYWTILKPLKVETRLLKTDAKIEPTLKHRNGTL